MTELKFKVVAQIGDMIQFQARDDDRLKLSTIEAYYVDSKGVHYKTAYGGYITQKEIVAVSNPAMWSKVQRDENES